MDVPSFPFLGFAAVVAGLVNLSAAAAWRRSVLLVANIAFLLSFVPNPVALAPFAGLLALGYVGVKIMERLKQKIVFMGLVVLVLVVFCWLKRYTFIPSTLFLTFSYVTIGVSYVFFRIMHLLIDAFQEALPERIGPLSYLNYTLNFTCLVSGPIQLYQDYHRTETNQSAPLDSQSVGVALTRIIGGFFKVSIVSPLLFLMHSRVILLLSAIANPPILILDAALGIAVFPAFVYFNFSGYTDFVIGIARFLRLELPENFNDPFSAKGFIDFWARWHMTLSGWLKTYVYNPLLMSMMRWFPSKRIEPWLGVGAYFVTFFLIGAWHGQTSAFLFYGILLGLGVSVNKLYQIAMTARLGRSGYRELCSAPVYSSFSRGLTFTWFAFSLLWFWSTWHELGKFFILLGPIGLTFSLLVVLIAATLVLAGREVLREYGNAVWDHTRFPIPPPLRTSLRTAWYTSVAVLVISAAVVLNAPAPHIVYKAF
ncbi:MAG TPA: MBOAT family O-acyltransferase [Candidatus Baltobacteraceae bacterium]|nr:MBOAT family O-acyltransferase [Candidatus Baltobacteraceae bacterium]